MTCFSNTLVAVKLKEAITANATLPELLRVIEDVAASTSINLNVEPVIHDCIERREVKTYRSWANALYEGIKSYEAECGNNRPFIDFAESGEALFGITCVLTEDDEYTPEEGQDVFDDLSEMGHVESYDLTTRHADNAHTGWEAWLAGPDGVDAEVKVWIETCGDWSSNLE